jgi:riboflavin synthase
VDGAGTVVEVKPVDANREIAVRFPAELGRYLARKGSIAINGVSLTINGVTDDSFSVNLIPHTLAVTNLRDLKQGDRVNLEIDVIARYVGRMLKPSA